LQSKQRRSYSANLAQQDTHDHADNEALFSLVENDDANAQKDGEQGDDCRRGQYGYLVDNVQPHRVWLIINRANNLVFHQML
jgi:hypothetical protein